MAVALVNLLTDGEERGRAYQAPSGAERAAGITACLRQTGITTPVSEPQGAAFATMAAGLRGVFEAVAAADVDGAAERLNDMLLATGAHPLLERHDEQRWHIHFHSAVNERVAAWAAGCATGLAVVVGGEYADRLGVCTAPHCDRVYVDVSRNGSRRYCSTACQNRVKAAAFREAHRQS
jgi:predicted RNA-binding Zn ribbon-like protein